MKKCLICNKEIKSGKYCKVCEMKSNIIFGTDVKNVVNHINKGNKAVKDGESN